MDLDTYWKTLIDRVYEQKEKLQGDEDIFYRLSCIYGETMVDGIEAYFERRYKEYDLDMAALKQTGFANIASDFDEARKVMFGDALLEESFISSVVAKMLDENTEMQSVLQAIDIIYQRLIERLEVLAEYKYQFGLRQGFYLEPA